MDFTQVKGYSELDSSQISLLANVYAQHMDTLDDPIKYDKENIKEVVWNNSLQTVDVHFNNGELVHYDSTGKWTYE
ncbi:MAG: glutathione reductase [Carnobacterium sp.]|uniref:Uncharacterized protein n=1 Tax=Carnobacterium viridans TaxID=174587 RepID=A0A1H0YZ14_9LACT|nr:hypothetical protein [Carnobacterium viridans]UDE94887.1 glutathione reductase [Carnobacterium viridans]SDQ20086.1 hypothetical protein SAMN04487752_1219 [Carnobacterium viridans]